MIAAVFGIVITVVSIIVQLSADRYTGVARMFLRDRVNLGGDGLLRHRLRVRRLAQRCRSSSDYVPRVGAARDDVRHDRRPGADGARTSATCSGSSSR